MSTSPEKDSQVTDQQVGSGTPRGADERRETVDPAKNPAPRSPEPDREAVEKGQEVLERVKPY
jgi:hypothetical protein